MGMTMIEKILARSAGVSKVSPGEVVTVDVETAVVIDLNFLPHDWREPKKVWSPDKCVVIFDHIAPASDERSAILHTTGRDFVRNQKIKRFHDVGPDQGIAHQLVADFGYALPGTVLVCVDSHTCSGGAFNCAARGIGGPELIYVLATGKTWFQVGTTVRYEFHGALPPVLNSKDLIIHIANVYGDHATQNVEYAGPGVANMSLNARRTLSTMSAEISAEFATFEADELCQEYLRSRTDRPFEPQFPDPDASYDDVRTIDLSALEPLVAYPDTIVKNGRPVREAAGERVDQAFIGSCANGTLDDLEVAARIVKGRRVDSRVRFIVTPGSQAIYREALRRGYIADLMEAGAVVTASTCGACAGLSAGALAPGERCITASTRNYKGRMGSQEAEIFLASPATVAATALRGTITDPREFI